MNVVKTWGGPQRENPEIERLQGEILRLREDNKSLTEIKNDLKLIIQHLRSEAAVAPVDTTTSSSSSSSYSRSGSLIIWGYHSSGESYFTSVVPSRRKGRHVNINWRNRQVFLSCPTRDKEHELLENYAITRVAEFGSLSAKAKLAIQFFVKRVFTISATNASFLHVIAKLQI